MSGPVYTYTLCTPDAASPMNQTTSLIQANFQAMNELIAVNHVTFNESDSGKHNFISLPNTTDPSTGPIEIDMYTKVTGSPNPSELFIRYPNDGDVVQISVSIPTPATGSSGGSGSQGWCSFPSGIILRWGTFSVATNSNPQVFISLTQGPQYTTSEITSASAPTSYGCLMPDGIFIYPGNPGNPGKIYTVLYGYVSVSTVVNFNYLLIGI